MKEHHNYAYDVRSMLDSLIEHMEARFTEVQDQNTYGMDDGIIDAVDHAVDQAYTFQQTFNRTHKLTDEEWRQLMRFCVEHEFEIDQFSVF